MKNVIFRNRIDCKGTMATKDYYLFIESDFMMLSEPLGGSRTAHSNNMCFQKEAETIVSPFNT